MKVILTENIPDLGEIGQVINVAPGYARNYLLPKGIVLEATGKNVRELEHRKRVLAQKREKVRKEMMSLAEKLNQVSIVMRRKVAEEDKLYGSVSASDIAAALAEKGFDIQRKDLLLEQPIKQIGEFTVPVRVHAQIAANIRLVVQKEE
ncbi:MAG: 50S ribosomal protein L9 [Syntrophobacteraceae bacterium]|jgi:large subunit ribosomal protein L9|nr:50S ribosomal protein L9 [Syntrophobacteraceae bacterium]